MNASLVASRICKDLFRSVVNRGDRSFIVTNFHYPDGDCVLLYFESKGNRAIATDMGLTLRKLEESDVFLTDVRKEFVKGIVNSHGIEWDGISFRRALSTDSPGVDCVALCEAISKISNLEFEPSSRRVRSFSSTLRDIIREKIEPRMEVYPGWYSSHYDTAKAFQVDYRINDTAFVFEVGNDRKTHKIAATCGFLYKHKLFLKTVSVIDPDANLKKDDRARLKEWGDCIEGLAEKEQNRLVALVLGG